MPAKRYLTSHFSQHFAKGKSKSDLALLSLILKAGEFFKTQKEAMEFVSKHFEVEDRSGSSKRYQPHSIKKSLNEIEASKRKQAWKKLRKLIDEHFESER